MAWVVSYNRIWDLVVGQGEERILLVATDVRTMAVWGGKF